MIVPNRAKVQRTLGTGRKGEEQTGVEWAWRGVSGRGTD